MISSGALTVRNGPGGLWGSSSAINLASSGGMVDMGQHYYKLGYDDGRVEGISIGDAAGYDVAYPTAYAAAYDTGVQTGTIEGTVQGSTAGAAQGYSAGWSWGYDEGYGQGFDAGVYYYLAGGTLSSNTDVTGSSSDSSVASVPEPASWSSLSIGALVFLRRRSRR
jgi:hypothetical protein